MFKSTAYGTDITHRLGDRSGAAARPGPEHQHERLRHAECRQARSSSFNGGRKFAQKFALADASGAGAMVFINEGQPGRTEPLWFNFDGLDNRLSPPRSTPWQRCRTAC